MLSRLLLLLLAVVAFARPVAAAPAPTIADRYRAATPIYVRSLVPQNPGSITLQLEDGARHELGFMGTSQLERVVPQSSALRAQFISTPGGRWNFGFAFYQGVNFNYGLPRRYAINNSNRYTSKNDAFGTIRMVIWFERRRWEVMEGEIRFTKFRESSRQGSIRIWEVEGTASGEFLLQGQPDPKLPTEIDVKSAAFACVLIEDRSPCPNRVELQFDLYYNAPGPPAPRTLVLPIQAAKFQPDATSQSLAIDAFEPPARGSGHIVDEFFFQVHNSANVSWPLQGQYQLNRQTVEPLEYLMPQYGSTRRPLVLVLVHRSELDVEMHYMPESGTLDFDSAQLLAANDQQEVWRVKGRLSGLLKLDNRKVGMGNSLAPLAIHPRDDLEILKLISGRFDILIRRPAAKQPAWKREYPGLKPIVGLELPNV